MAWKLDLEYGLKRQEDFLKLVPFLAPVPGTKEDFVAPNGDKWELKSERRTAAQTLNIAIETKSSYRRPGALYNAFKNGVKYIAWFFACGAIFIYDCKRLFYYVRHLLKKRMITPLGVANSSAKIILLKRKQISWMQITF